MTASGDVAAADGGELVPTFGKRFDIPDGRRRTARQRVVLVGPAMLMEGSRSVIVDDVCSTGARLRGRHLPATGTDVIVRVGGMDILGTIAWSEREQCGVEFECPLDHNDVEELMTAGGVGRVWGLA